MDNSTVTSADILEGAVYFNDKLVEPFVNDYGIYVLDDFNPRYHKLLITKDLFVEAYNRWIADERKYD